MLGPYVPTWHGRQVLFEEAPSTVEYFPLSQAAQTSLSNDTKFMVTRACSWYVPIEHHVHTVAPSLKLLLPISHGIQVDGSDAVLTFEKVPTTQGIQDGPKSTPKPV